MQAPEIADEDLIALPSNFARHILGIEPYPWQEEVMDLVGFGDMPVSLLAANESGKTSVVAATLVLWHCNTFPNSKVVTTAGVYRQVKEQLWPSLKRYENLFEGAEINITDARFANGARAVGFATDDAGLFEGFHGKSFDDEPLMMIVDEAKSVDSRLFEAIERCRPQRLLIMSSAGGSSGFFFETQTKKKKFYRTFRVTAEDCPHLPQEKIQQTIAKYGKEHPLVLSMIYSQFVDDQAEQKVIARSEIQACLATPPKKDEKGVGTLFLDFGAGAGETVLAQASGNTLKTLIAWKETNTMSTVGRCIIEFKKLGAQPKDIYGDEGGIGKPMIDRLAEAGWPINRVNNGSTKVDDKMYKNVGAEQWYHMKSLIEKRQCILIDDEILIDQLSDRRILYDSAGKLGLEPKEAMSSRGVVSPDRADAVCGAFFMHHRMKAFENFNRKSRVSMDRYEEAFKTKYRGFDAGL